MKLNNILHENSRHTPAIITMKRGTVIHGDHVRIATYPGGKKYVIVGIKPGVYTRKGGALGYHGRGVPLVRKMRDFYAPERYVPSYGQDETGWDLESEEYEDGTFYYDAHRDCIHTRKFRNILTINPDNIASIDWGSASIRDPRRTL